MKFRQAAKHASTHEQLSKMYQATISQHNSIITTSKSPEFAIYHMATSPMQLLVLVVTGVAELVQGNIRDFIFLVSSHDHKCPGSRIEVIRANRFIELATEIAETSTKK